MCTAPSLVRKIMNILALCLCLCQYMGGVLDCRYCMFFYYPINMSFVLRWPHESNKPLDNQGRCIYIYLYTYVIHLVSRRPDRWRFESRARPGPGRHGHMDITRQTLHNSDTYIFSFCDKINHDGCTWIERSVG